MSAIQDKKNNKRLRLIDAAYSLFMEKSVNLTAIDDVVKAAGVAKGTFYLYFKDKYDLLDQIVMRKSAEVVEQAYRKMSSEKTDKQIGFDNEVITFIDLLISEMQKRKELVALMDKNLSKCFRNMASITESDFAEVSAALLKKFTENGYTLEKAKMQIYLIVDMVGSVCADAFLYKKPYTIEEIKPLLLLNIQSILNSQKEAI